MEIIKSIAITAWHARHTGQRTLTKNTSRIVILKQKNIPKVLIKSIKPLLEVNPAKRMHAYPIRPIKATGTPKMLDSEPLDISVQLNLLLMLQITSEPGENE